MRSEFPGIPIKFGLLDMEQFQGYLTRVRNCAFLVANATENFALATRICQLLANRRPAISP